MLIYIGRVILSRTQIFHGHISTTNRPKTNELRDQDTGRRGVICDLDCWLQLNFTVNTTHCPCFYTVESSKLSFDRLINLVKYYPTLRKTAEGFDCGRIAFRSFPPSIRWYFTRFVTRSHDGLIGQVHSKQRWLVGSAVKFSLRLPSQITLLRPLIEIASDSLWSLGASVEEKQFFNFPASTNTSVVVVLTYSSLRKQPIILLIGLATRDICSNQSELLSISG